MRGKADVTCEGFSGGIVGVEVTSETSDVVTLGSPKVLCCSECTLGLSLLGALFNGRKLRLPFKILFHGAYVRVNDMGHTT
jgi:hypothetical protein